MPVLSRRFRPLRIIAPIALCFAGACGGADSSGTPDDAGTTTPDSGTADVGIPDGSVPDGSVPDGGPAPMCNDSIKNGTETDVDCGGSCPTHCADGAVCAVSGDCLSNVCDVGKCAAATCGDGVKNGTETDVDCGGAACVAAARKCGSGKVCLSASDCSFGNTCKAGKCSSAPGISHLSAGEDNICAILDTGSLKCWGDSKFGESGLQDAITRGDNAGEMGNALPAVDLGAGRTAVSVTAYGDHTCALLDDASVKCWGFNDYGQLGLGDTVTRGGWPGSMGDNLPPVAFPPQRNARALSVGASHSCAILDNGDLSCWGRNGRGELGLGDTINRGDVPGQMGRNLPKVDLGAGRTAVSLSASMHRTCAILDNGTLKCWGDNVYGQLGLGDTTDRYAPPPTPIDLGQGRTAVAISAGTQTTCALLDNGSVKCWGWNIRGQLGLGHTTDSYAPPATAIDLGQGRTAIAVSAGWDHACAILDNGSLKCWGCNEFGQLGLGDTNNRGDNPGEMGDALPAVDLGAGRTAVAVSVGQNAHTCALLDNGSVKCWGWNAAGFLGLGDTRDRGGNPGEMGDNLLPVDLGGLVH